MKETPKENIERKYFSISEVASMLNVAPSLIRFWESQFESIQPKKNKQGVRYYTQADIKTLNSIYYLVKTKGYKLQGAREILTEKGKNVSDAIELIKELEELKEFLHILK